MNKTILYIGRFELPDKEATANRVVANAKLLRDLGYKVILAGCTEDHIENFEGKWRETSYFDFLSYEKPKAKTTYEKFDMFVNANPELSLIEKIPDLALVIAYDFPAVALSKIMRACKKKHIPCIADISEWYCNGSKNLAIRCVRAFDSFYRMSILHKRMRGIIVISRYLQEYYNKSHLIRIPPLVDIQDNKWNLPAQKSNDITVFVYAGWPSKTKERLDVCVKSIIKLSRKYPVMLNIVGITKEQFIEIYDFDYANMDKYFGSVINFTGRVSHFEALQYVRNADYSIIIREASRKTMAGFPSKFVESISCGTSVIATNISNVCDYLKNNKNGFLVPMNSIEDKLEHVILQKNEIEVDRNTFDYRNFKAEIELFLKELGV